MQDCGSRESFFTNTLITSGVPKRIVLQPLLFGVALSDMQTVAKAATFTSYDDETKGASSVKDPLAVNHLHEDLDAIYKWS